MPDSALAFLSYAHNDDYDGQVTRFVDRLRRELRSQLGRDFPIFRDRDDLKWGQTWKRRIDESVDSATFLIAILSPSFFRSEECRRELERFRERERQLGRDDLILPVVWIAPDELSDEKNQLAELLRQRQYISWERFRHHRSFPVTASRLIASLARQTVEAMRRESTSVAPGSGKVPSSSPETTDSPAPGELRMKMIGNRPHVSIPESDEADEQSQPQKAQASPSPDSPQPGDVRTNPIDGQLYIWIPPGQFEMGCSPGYEECSPDESPRHTVRITRGFWLGRTPVTQAAYEKVIGSNPSFFKGADHPVDNVRWEEARRYCEAVGGRLPTEAEWEYAARAGSTVSRYGDLDEIARYGSSSESRTWPVEQKLPNAWGLYDVIGNVWEWVSDWYAEGYYGTLPSLAVDPKGPDGGEYHVLRGGSWVNGPRLVRVSNRDWYEPQYRGYIIGFRCVLDRLL